MGGARDFARARQGGRLRRELRRAHVLHRRGHVPARRAARCRGGGGFGGRLLCCVSTRARRGAALMDIAAGLMQGFAVALHPANLLWCFVGVLLGTAETASVMAAITSSVTGTVGVIALGLIAPPLARFALAFSSPEYFALMALGLAMVVLLAGRSLLKALLAMLVGLWIAGIGTD